MDRIPFRFTGKERDEETGLYYYGARYLDPKTSRWISTDPAVGEYIPGAPVNDEVRKRNENLPGMGGVYNLVNTNLYHYAFNNPVRYTDPDGRDGEDEVIISAAPEVPTSTENENGDTHIYLTPFEKVDGIDAVWAEFKLDTSNGGGEIEASAGFLSMDKETETPAFVGFNADIVAAEGKIKIDNDGMGVGFGGSLASVGGSFGLKIGKLKIGLGGSIGIQVGFELEGTKDGFILDAAWIFGGRIEVNWNRKKEK